MTRFWSIMNDMSPQQLLEVVEVVLAVADGEVFWVLIKHNCDNLVKNNKKVLFQVMVVATPTSSHRTVEDEEIIVVGLDVAVGNGESSIKMFNNLGSAGIILS